jgi:hypothetical protein
MSIAYEEPSLRQHPDRPRLIVEMPAPRTFEPEPPECNCPDFCELDHAND